MSWLAKLGLRTLLWSLAWREMSSHPRRTLLTLASIVIGVACVLSVGMSVHTARRAYREMYETITGRAALEITKAGGGLFDPAVLETVRATPGVEAALPLIQRPTILYHQGVRMRLTSLGIVPQADEVIREFEMVAGDSFRSRDDILLDESLASTAGIQVGDTVHLLTRRGRVAVNVAGLLRPRTGAGVREGVLLMPITEAQRRFATRGQIDRIQIVLAEDQSPTAVQDKLAQRLSDPGLVIAPPPTHSPMAEETFLSTEHGLRLATAFSLLAATFIILNTFLMSVSQRWRELAIMRALGATAAQIRGALWREALLLGVIGTAFGLMLGIIGARVLNQALAEFFLTSIPTTDFRPTAIATAVLFGMGIALLGVWWPAIKASRVSPQEGMRGIVQHDASRMSPKLKRLGLIGLVVSSVVLAGSIRGYISMQLAISATVSLFVSLILLLPIVIRPLMVFTASIMRRFLQVETDLASRQLLRHANRTALTVGVLFVTIATGMGLANSVLDNIEDVRRWYRTSIVGDFFVRATNPDMKTGLSAAIPDEVAEQLELIDGIVRIDSVRLLETTVGDQRVFVIASQEEYPRRGGRSILSGLPAEQESVGEAIRIGSVLAQRTGLGPGDTMTLETGIGQQELVVATISNDYFAGGLTVHLPRLQAEQLFEVQGVDAYVVSAESGKREMVRAGLETIAREQGVLLQSYAELVSTIERMMAGVVASLWGLMLLGFIVAGLGVANTLGMNVLEQTRELGMLHVVGMTADQLRRTIVVQGILLGCIALLPGLLAGMAMAYVMSLATLPTLGRAVEFHWRPGLLVAVAVAALAIILLAGWFPARRASRLSLLDALRYE